MATSVDDECEKLRSLGRNVGAFVAEKHEAYGGAYTGGAALLRELAPDGVRPEQYVAAILATRIFEKLRRFFVAPQAFGESPLVDVVGHALCLAVLYGAEPPPAPEGSASPDPGDPGPADVGLARRLLARYLSGGDSGSNEVDVQAAYRALGGDPLTGTPAPSIEIDPAEANPCPSSLAPIAHGGKRYLCHRPAGHTGGHSSADGGAAWGPDEHGGTYPHGPPVRSAAPYDPKAPLKLLPCDKGPMPGACELWHGHPGLCVLASFKSPQPVEGEATGAKTPGVDRRPATDECGVTRGMGAERCAAPRSHEGPHDYRPTCAARSGEEGDDERDKCLEWPGHGGDHAGWRSAWPNATEAPEAPKSSTERT